MAAESTIDEILSEPKAQRASLIKDLIRSHYEPLLAKTVSLEATCDLRRIGPLSLNGKRGPDVEMSETVELLVSEKYAIAEQCIPSSGVRELATFDGKRGWKYLFRDSAEAFQVDTFPASPQITGPFFIIFQITGLGGVFKNESRLEDWSSYEFAGEEQHPQLGRVLLLSKAARLPNGQARTSTKCFFGDVDGQLAFLGSEYSLVGVPSDLGSSVQNIQWSVEYSTRNGYTFPTRWSCMETRYIVNERNEPLRPPRVYKKDTYELKEFRVLEDFPLDRLEVPVAARATIVDHSVKGKTRGIPERRNTVWYLLAAPLIIICFCLVWVIARVSRQRRNLDSSA